MPLFSKSKTAQESKPVKTSTRTIQAEQRVVNSSSFSSYHHLETSQKTKISTGSASVLSHKNVVVEKGRRSSNNSSSSSLQKIAEQREFLALPKSYSSSIVNTDAKPFTRTGVYRSAPPRSAFFSTPLTTLPSNSLRGLGNNQPNITTINPSSNRSASVSYPVKSTSAPVLNDKELGEKLQIKVVKSPKFYDDPTSNKVPVYKTRSKQRGKLLLINNIKFANEKEVRRGAEWDEKNLIELFKQMGFEVTTHRNLKLKDMKARITDFRKSKLLKKVDIGAVIVMSHGTGKERSDSTEVVCTDNELLETTWIIDQFNSTACPDMAGKPKIFIFQCCRGDNFDNTQTDNLKSSIPRQLSDMLIAYATVPGFVAHRNPEWGSWYIQAICKVFMEHAYDTDVESLLKMVDNNLSNIASSGSKQTSSFENRGFRTCYLHPGLSER